MDFSVGRVNPAGRGPPHPFSHLMAAVVVSPAPPVHHFPWLPTVAHRAIFCYGKPTVCLVLYVAHFMPRISLPPPCRKRLQINKNRFDSTVAAFGICLNQRHPVNILTHIEIRRLLPCISSEELGAGSFRFTQLKALTAGPSGLNLHWNCGAQNLWIPRFTVRSITALARLSTLSLPASLALGRKGFLCRISGPPYRLLGPLVLEAPS